MHKTKNHWSTRLLKHRYKILLKSGNDIDHEVFKYDKLLEHYVTENMILEVY